MRNIIQFAYTGSITWNEVQNMVSLIKDADFFGLDDIKEQGLKILSSCLDASNSLEAYHLSNILSISLLKKQCQQLIFQNFDIVSKSEEFIKLDFASVKDIFSHRRIHCTEKIFEGILRWIVTDLEIRKLHVNDVLGLVDYTHFDSDKFIRIATNVSMASKEHK